MCFCRKRVERGSWWLELGICLDCWCEKYYCSKVEFKVILSTGRPIWKGCTKIGV